MLHFNLELGKEKKAKLRKNKKALQTLKKGTPQRKRVAAETATLLKSYKNADNRKRAAEKMLEAIEKKHQLQYLQLTAGIAKLEDVLKRIPKS